MNIVEPLLQHAKSQPTKLALIHRNQHRTYEELVCAMKKVANGIQRKGLEKERIAILSANRIEMVEVIAGIMYSGNIPVILDPKWSQQEVQLVLEQAQPKLVFSETEFEEFFLETTILTFTSNKKGNYEDWLASLTEDSRINKDNECLFIAFTSGTTGVPKGYVRTHLSWIESFQVTREAFQLESMEHVLAPGPFVHSLSLFALMQTLYYGGTFHLVSKFSEMEVFTQCKRFSNMILFVVPTMIEKMLQIDSFKDTHVQAIISTGAKWNNTSKKRASHIFPEAKFFEFYGSSEASYISFLIVNEMEKEHSVGKAFPGVELSIRDEQFQQVQQGEIGRLFIRSHMMFLGYFNLPHETEGAFHDGWLKIGDFAYIDEDGELYLVGREKNRLITGGLNVYPEEVEFVLQQLPEIEEIMIVGVPDEIWGDRLVACIQWKEQPLTIDELRQFGKGYLESYKLPKEILSVSKFTYTSSGKPARKAMTDKAVEVLACEKQSL